MLTTLPDDAFTRRTSGSPFTRRLGVASAQLGRGHAMSLLPLADAILAGDGTVHEGAIAALVDCAGGAASWSIDGFDPDGRAATIGMHLCFDVGTRGEDVAAEAVTSWNSDGVYVSSVTVGGTRVGAGDRVGLGDLPDRQAGEASMTRMTAAELDEFLHRAFPAGRPAPLPRRGGARALRAHPHAVPRRAPATGRHGVGAVA